MVARAQLTRPNPPPAPAGQQFTPPDRLEDYPELIHRTKECLVSWVVA